MELRHLSAFLMVAEELNFSRAAARLFIGQPALSRLVKQLERELGAPLFDRSTHHVALTGAGEALRGPAREALRCVEEAERAVQQPALANGARLRISVSEWTAGFVQRALRRVGQTSIDLDLTVHQHDEVDQLDQLREGAVDVAFGRTSPDDRRLASQVIADEPIIAVLPVEHPLVGNVEPAMLELLKEPLVLLPRTHCAEAHDHIMALCDETGVRPQVVQEVSSLSSVSLLAAAGVGVSFVPASAASHFDDEHVAWRSIAAPCPSSPVVMSWPQNGSAPAAGSFLDAVATAADLPFGS